MPPKNKKADKMDSLRLQTGQAGKDKWQNDVATWGQRSSSVRRGHQTVATQASAGNPLATAVLREIEDDTRTAAKLFELSVGIKQPRESKLCHFVMLAFSQLCYLTGSHEMRSMSSWMPFELH